MLAVAAPRQSPRRSFRRPQLLCAVAGVADLAVALQWYARLKKDRAMTTTDWVLSSALAVVGLVVISSMLW
jgi:hypothetical protein